MYLFLWLLLIYAFLGWCAEVAYATVNTGKFVNRGFLNGPLCPIYGFGAVSVIAVLTPLKDHILLLFLGSFVLTSGLELLTGWVMEKIFSHKWWDYSELPFNIKGYVCLKFSLIWGIICILLMEVIHPIIQSFVLLMDNRVGQLILGILYAYLAIDIIATVQSVLKLNKQLEQINHLAEKIRNLSEEIGEKISEGSLFLIGKGEEFKIEMAEFKDSTIDAIGEGKIFASKVIDEQKERHAQMLDKSFFGQKRILRAFPHMKSKKYNQELDELKKKHLIKLNKKN